MLHDEQAGADRGREQRQGRRQRVGEKAGALAAAEHQQRERPLGPGGLIALRGPVDHRIAHRIAGQAGPGRAGLRGSLVVSNEVAMAVTRLGQHAVGAAQHGVLLVQGGGDAAQAWPQTSGGKAG